MNNQLNNVYLEISKCDKEGRATSFEPMTKKQMVQLARLLHEEEKKQMPAIGGWTNGDRIVYMNVRNTSSFTVAWRYEQKQTEVAYAQGMNISAGPIKHPPILFWAQDNSLHVACYKKWQGLKTVLYNLPFHNVYQNCSICMGSSRTRFIDGDTIHTYIKRHEFQFFATKGSHIHHAAGCTMNINTLHRSLRQGEDFPMDCLVELYPLKQLIDEFDKESK